MDEYSDLCFLLHSFDEIIVLYIRENKSEGINSSYTLKVCTKPVTRGQIMNLKAALEECCESMSFKIA